MKKLLLFYFIFPSVLIAQSIADTLWAPMNLDGGIAFRPGSGIFNIYGGGSLLAGDGYDWFFQEEVFDRSYLSFDLRDLTNPDTSAIIEAVIGIYQSNSSGNSQLGVYPIWNVPGGDTIFCILDHIDYGSSLDLGDWTAGDPGDPQTLNTNIGIISDNATVEYKTMDVTRYVKEDIANQCIYNQYRIRFTIDRDFDLLNDLLQFRSANGYVTLPFLAVLYLPTGISSKPIQKPKDFILHQNYPNPFNSSTTIEYSLIKPGKVELIIYDNSGRKTSKFVSKRQNPGVYCVFIDASDWSSGVYYYRLKFNNQSITKKMLLIF